MTSAEAKRLLKGLRMGRKMAKASGNEPEGVSVRVWMILVPTLQAIAQLAHDDGHTALFDELQLVLNETMQDLQASARTEH